MVMRTVTVSEAKATLSELLESILAGQEIAIGRHGKAEAKLVRIERSDEPRVLVGHFRLVA